MAKPRSGPAIATCVDAAPPALAPVRPVFFDPDPQANERMDRDDLLLRASELRLAGRARGWALLCLVGASWLLTLVAGWALCRMLLRLFD